ncbi:kinase-like protein [Clavulina sp. PMI_390]|nr:kinase-like protein [Clavulina sp. PMI_390]
MRLLQDLSSQFNILPACLRIDIITFDRRDVIGRGGEATVYRGQMLQKPVVIREVVMARREWNRPLGRKVTKLVHREALTHSWLSHANIIPFLGIYHEEVGSPPMVVLPFVDGGSLQDLLDDEPLTLEQFEKIVLGTAQGVLYLHTRTPPIIHGDLHPGNILLGKSGHPYICDFGLSRLRHEITRTRTMMFEAGRLRFLAPELSSGSEPFRTTPESDIFSLAMTFLNAWTGEPPFFDIENERRVSSEFQIGNRPTMFYPGFECPGLLSLLSGMWAQIPSARPLMPEVLGLLLGIFQPAASMVPANQAGQLELMEPYVGKIPWHM